MCQTFLPQLSNTGRIVSLSSVASNINIYSEEIQNRFRSAATIADLEQIAQDFEVSNPGKFVNCYKPCPCTPRPLVITMIIIMIMIQPPGINHRFISNTKLEARPAAPVTRNSRVDLFFSFFFQNSVRTSTESAAGFGGPQRSYNVSKALLRAATRILSQQHRTEYPDSHVLINCCCPGWIDTDMGGLVSRRGTRPPKTAEEGARIPVRLALDHLGGVTGEYLANESVRSRDDGAVQRWE